MKFSEAYNHIKMRRFSDISGTNTVLTFSVCWWFGRTKTDDSGSFGSTKPPAHPDDGDRVRSQNVGKPSRLGVAVCPRRLR